MVAIDMNDLHTKISLYNYKHLMICLQSIFGSSTNSAIIDKMTNKTKTPHVRIILQSNKQIVETEVNVLQPSTHIYIHDLSLAWLGAGTTM